MSCCEQAATHLIDALGGEEIAKRVVGGVKWWQACPSPGAIFYHFLELAAPRSVVCKALMRNGSWSRRIGKKQNGVERSRKQRRQRLLRRQSRQRQNQNQNTLPKWMKCGVCYISMVVCAWLPLESPGLTMIVGGYYFGSIDQQRFVEYVSLLRVSSQFGIGTACNAMRKK